MKAFSNYPEAWQSFMWWIIVITITIGNLFAIRQQNLKRFLAFSSISQAGYVVLGVFAGSAHGMATMVFYLFIYMFTNLAAFGVISTIENKTGKLNMDDYNGLYSTNPKLAFVMMLAMFSLGGIPIFAGFFSKFFIFAAMFVVGALFPRIPFPAQNGPYSGFVIEARENYVIFQAGFDRYYVSSKDNDFELGDYLVIDGSSNEIKFTTYESRFNFKEYLSNKGVDKELKASNIDRKFHSFIRTQQFKRQFLSHFDENAASLIGAFLFNEKDYSSSAISYANNIGVIYLLSMSGIYLHLLFAVLAYLLSLKLSKKASQILPFLVLLPFASKPHSFFVNFKS